MPALQGVGVLVTRPKQQAGPLCRLLESEGASTLAWPVIEIAAAADLSQTAERIRGAHFDLVLFTSANSVHFGAHLVNGGPSIAAIGPATARALGQAGLATSVLPTTGFDSEGLLQHPAFVDAVGKNVLLVKGTHGRDLLRQQLMQRGARVTTADVYRRERIPRGTAELADLTAKFSGGQLQLITATSVEIGYGLLDLATPALRREFDSACWLVPGARIAAALRERRVVAPIAQADSAEDQDLVTAALRWRRAASGA